jgi:hypothetical protein
MKSLRTIDACHKSAVAALTRRVLDVHNADMFPNIAEARKHYASLSAERKAHLEKAWNDG